jgi:hypothetical protein
LDRESSFDARSPRDENVDNQSGSVAFSQYPAKRFT